MRLHEILLILNSIIKDNNIFEIQKLKKYKNTFTYIANVSLKQNDDEYRLFIICRPTDKRWLTKMKDNEAIVCEIIKNGNKIRFVYIDDDNLIKQVFDEYYKNLK